jgi:hypothetical protein
MMVKSRSVGGNCRGRDVVTSDVMNGASRNSVTNGSSNLDAMHRSRSVLGTHAIGADVTPRDNGATDRRIHYVE